MNHLDTVIFPTVCVEYARFQRDWHDTNDPCPFPFIFGARSVYETPQITALVDPRCSNPQENCEGLYGEPCQLPLGGRMISPTCHYQPQWSHRNGKRSVSAYYYFYPPPVAQKMNHTCQSFSLVQGGHVCLY